MWQEALIVQGERFQPRTITQQDRTTPALTQLLRHTLQSHQELQVLLLQLVDVGLHVLNPQVIRVDVSTLTVKTIRSTIQLLVDIGIALLGGIVHDLHISTCLDGFLVQPIEVLFQAITLGPRFSQHTKDVLNFGTHPRFLLLNKRTELIAYG